MAEVSEMSSGGYSPGGWTPSGITYSRSSITPYVPGLRPYAMAILLGSLVVGGTVAAVPGLASATFRRSAATTYARTVSKVIPRAVPFTRFGGARIPFGPAYLIKRGIEHHKAEARSHQQGGGRRRRRWLLEYPSKI